MNIAVLLITFNRLECLKKVFEKVREAAPSRIYLSSDGWRSNVKGEKEKILEIRNWLLSHIDWDCQVKTRFLEKNSGGCKKGVSGALNWFFSEEKEGIILEDDCVPSISFFEYCKVLLEKYRNDEKVFSISGYLPTDKIKSKYFYEFSNMSHCWGWATWANKWSQYCSDINHLTEDNISSLYVNKAAKKYWKNLLPKIKNNEIDSWYFPWNFCISSHKGLTIFPCKNLISNIGVDGIHYKNNQDSRLNSKVFNLDLQIFNNGYKTKKMNKVLWDNFYDKQSNFHLMNSSYTFAERLFSIKNNPSKTRKIITILGLQIKIRKTHPNRVIDWSNKKKYVKNIKQSFKNCYGYKLDLDNPRTLSEKMMWLRVYDNTPLKTLCADKYAVREYVKEKIGEEYLIPLYGAYDNFDEIDFDSLPNQFVIKCNHGSGYNIIVKDKSQFNKEEAKDKIEAWLKEDFSTLFGEIHYSPIKRKIIIEQYIENLDGDIEDYKYFCFNGKPYYILYCTDRKSGVLKNSFFDMSFKNMQFNYTGELYTKELEAPKNLLLMNEISEKLSKDFKHVRVDLYNIKGKIYFGELTFTGYGGYYNFKPSEWNLKLGNLLDLGNIKEKNENQDRAKIYR